METDCCIVGAGPAGAVLSLLLARQGVSVTLLEAHADFDRDFRGDALQPAALDLIGQMGLAERLFSIALARHAVFPLRTASETLPFLDVSRLATPYPFITLARQSEFLPLVIDDAERCTSFRRVMGARVESLLYADDGRVSGVRYRAQDGSYDVRAKLVVGADGRFSRVRGLAGFQPRRTAPPFDLLWFRLPRRPDERGGGVCLGARGWLVLLNRGSEWQVAYSLPKGGFPALKELGASAMGPALEDMTPWLADRAGEIRDWSQTSLLSVEVSRLDRWYRPGLLLIGDSAHTMSPVAGVGISLAIQDAAVAANVLGPRLAQGSVEVADLAKVQRQRELAIRIVQSYQGLVQRWLMTPQRGHRARIPLALRLQARVPAWRDAVARIFGLGVCPVRLAGAS